MLLGVDVGGTFTDAVLALDGRLVTAKSPTTPEDQSEGVLHAVRAALERGGASADQVRAFAHGTTVATNALLEGDAARTVLVATEGFTDVVELGRQARADLYRLCAAHPAPLVPPELRVAAAERTGPDGVLRELTDLDGLVERVRALEPEAVAVCLLHAYRHPEHEERIGDALHEALDVHVSLSHAAVGTFREHERAATTEIDAALSPLLRAYLRRLVDRARDAGLPRPDVMQSSGGLTDVDHASAHAATTVLSGPAGGAAGAAWAAAFTGRDALCFDMGGTSCDVCVTEDGAVLETRGREVGDRPVALPMLDVHTVGAGGGSIAWVDAGGALRVGPRSAGARPGPAAYGHGGTEPTVTDANVVLGYLDGNPATPLAGGIELDVDAARRAVRALGERVGLGERECAQGIRDVANAEMVRALRVMTVERGVDPRALVLLPFGGAGPLHACAIADELGMDAILCPRASGVLAALGLVVSERRRDVQRSVLLSGDALTPDAVGSTVTSLLHEAAGAFDSPDTDGFEIELDVRAVYELRYRGQAFELRVDHATATSEAQDLLDPPTREQLREAFESAHERTYGFVDRDADVELVTVGVTASQPGPAVAAEAAAAASHEETSRRTAVFDGEELEATVLRGAPAPSTRVEGPAIVELPESTLVVAPGWAGEVDEAGSILLEREG